MVERWMRTNCRSGRRCSHSRSDRADGRRASCGARRSFELSPSASIAAMTSAARAVCLPLDPSLGEDVDAVGACFDSKLGANGRFDAASPGGRFSRHFVKARATQATPSTLAEARQILIATHVGGEVLTEWHGYPVRAVVPFRRGWFWVKWMGEIIVLDDAVEILKQPFSIR